MSQEVLFRQAVVNWTKTIEETIMKHAKSHNQASGGKGGGLFGVENFLTYCLIISLQN